MPVGLACQEQIVAGETAQNIVKFQPLQEQVKVQEIPEVQVIERIQEQIVPELIEEKTGNILVHPFAEEVVEVVQVILHGRLPRVRKRIDEHIVHTPIPLTSSTKGKGAQ